MNAVLSTTTAGAIFCYFPRISFSYMSLYFLFNKQLPTATTHIFRESGKLAVLITYVFHFHNGIFFPLFFFFKATQAVLLDWGEGVKAFYVRTLNTVQDLCEALVTAAEWNEGSSLCAQQPVASASGSQWGQSTASSQCSLGTADSTFHSCCFLCLPKGTMQRRAADALPGSVLTEQCPRGSLYKASGGEVLSQPRVRGGLYDCHCKAAVLFVSHSANFHFTPDSQHGRKSQSPARLLLKWALEYISTSEVLWKKKKKSN